MGNVHRIHPQHESAFVNAAEYAPEPDITPIDAMQAEIDVVLSRAQGAWELLKERIVDRFAAPKRVELAGYYLLYEHSETVRMAGQLDRHTLASRLYGFLDSSFNVAGVNQLLHRAHTSSGDQLGNLRRQHAARQSLADMTAGYSWVTTHDGVIAEELDYPRPIDPLFTYESLALLCSTQEPRAAWARVLPYSRKLETVTARTAALAEQLRTTAKETLNR